MASDRTSASPKSRLRILVVAMLVLTIPLAIIWWPGCRRYPPVSSPESLSLMKLLYAACNTKDPARLSRVEEGVETLSREGKMLPRERESFERIIALAKEGQWGEAEQQAFRFAEDQIGQGTSSKRPAGH